MTVSFGYLRMGRAESQSLPLTTDDLASDVESAYVEMARRMAAEPEQWGGWKLGGTNAASRNAFCVDGLFYGPIRNDEILHLPRRAPGAALPELKGEVELALRIAPDGTTWDSWAVVLEMPASGVTDLVDLGIIALVSDRCAAGALLLGPAQTGPLPGPAALLSQEIDGERVAEGTTSLLTSSPEDLFAEFLAVAQSHGAPVAPGQWIATGGITPCIAFTPGQRVTVRLDDAAVIDFIVTTDS